MFCQIASRPKPRYRFFDRSQLRDLPFCAKKAGHAIDFGQEQLNRGMGLEASWQNTYGSKFYFASFGAQFEPGKAKKRIGNVDVQIYQSC